MRRIAAPALVALALVPATAPADPRVTAAPGRIAVTFDQAHRLSERFGAVVARPDGSVLAAGATRRSDRLAITALRPDGSLDRGFGDGGGSVAPFDVREGDALVAAADGTLIAVGRQPSDDGSSMGAPAAVRLRADGTFDRAFGGDGVGEVPGVTQIGCVGCRLAALQADGGLLVAGFSGRDPDTARFAVARLRADGSADPGFGSGGVAQPLPGPGVAMSVVVQPDRIVVLGSRGPISNPDAQQSVLVALRPDGSLDPAFGTQGVVEVGANAYQLGQDAAGRLIVVTAPQRSAASDVLRYTPAGLLDPAWGAGGRVSLGRSVNGHVLATAAGVVVAEAIVGGPLAQFRLDDAGRILARPSTELPFGGGSFPRRGVGPIGRGSFFGPAIAIRPDGSLAVGGTVSIIEESEGDSDEVSQAALALVGEDGELARTITSGRPRLGVAVRRDRLGAIRRRGALRIRLTPRRRGLARVTVTARGRTIARGMAPFATVRRTTARVPLTRAGRRLLRSAARLGVRATVQGNDMAGNRTTVRATATLRR